MAWPSNQPVYHPVRPAAASFSQQGSACDTGPYMYGTYRFPFWQNSVEDGASIGLDSAVVECLAIDPANDATLVTLAPSPVHAASCQILCLNA